MAEVLKLQVETGAVTVEVEDERGEVIGTFDFNPSDSNILKRYDTVVDFFNSLGQKEDLSGEEQVAELNRVQEQIGEQFDMLLGYKVSDKLFGRCGPLTVTKNGDFFFEQALEGIGKLIEQVTQKRIDKKLARIRKAVEAAPKQR